MNLVILFSGQGLQQQQHVDEVIFLAEQFGYTTALTQQLPEIYSADFDSQQIFDNQLAQPLIFALQYLRWQQLKVHCAEPILFAGYSLGEASAFCCSAHLDFTQALAFIRMRAQVMTQGTTEDSGLVAIQGLSYQQLKPLLFATETELSIKLNDSHFICGGRTLQLHQLMISAQCAAAQHIQHINVSIPSHTNLMQSAAIQFAQYCETLPTTTMQIPMISATNGHRYHDADQARKILTAQIDHALDWSICMQTLAEYQPDLIVEIGPGKSLSKMTADFMPTAQSRSYDDFKQFEGLSKWIDKYS